MICRLGHAGIKSSCSVANGLTTECLQQVHIALVSILIPVGVNIFCSYRNDLPPFHIVVVWLLHSALAKATLDNTIDSFAQSALTSTSEANAFPEYLFTDESTANSNPSMSWANPSSSDLLPEALPKPADISSFTSSKSLCEGRTQTNGKLRIRDQSGSCKSPYSQITPPKLPSVQPLPHSADYGSDYEEQRPAVSPQDGALSEQDREKALREQNKALPEDDPLKCTHPPFFISVCCLGSLDLADFMVEGQTVFKQVEHCVSCKLVSFSLTRRLEGFGFIVMISQLADNAVLYHT